MTLLEYIEQGCKYHDTIMKYVNFKTFVESLHRKSNSALIESISTGVSVMLEAEVANFEVNEIPTEGKKGADKGNSDLENLINSLKQTSKGSAEYEATKKKVVGFLTQIIIKVAKSMAGHNRELFNDI